MQVSELCFIQAFKLALSLLAMKLLYSLCQSNEDLEQLLLFSNNELHLIESGAIESFYFQINKFK